MMNNDLIKRYIYAVICYFPAKEQPEVEKEIENMIAELLEARCGDNSPTDEDIRAVLIELGKPEELAVKYTGEEKKALLSGIYFLWFKRVVKIVAPIATVTIGFIALLSSLIDWQASQSAYRFAFELVAEVIGRAFNTALQTVFWVGVIFVFLEHQNVHLENRDHSGSDFLSRLRPVPLKQAQIKLHEPILDVFWNIAIVVLLLGFPNLIVGYWKSAGWIPAFNESYIRTYWFLVIIWAASGIGHSIIMIIERRYSKRLAVATVISNLFSGTVITIFFANNSIMNPDFVKNVINTMEFSKEPLEFFSRNLNVIFIVVILAVLMIETGITIYRAFRYDK